MSVKPEFETYSYAGRIARFKTQSIVECRLTGVGEIGSVLATRATAVLTSAEALDGEVRYNGKLLLGVIYEDADKNVCRMERGAEFTHRGQHEWVVPAHSAVVELNVLSSTVKREGASLYVSSLVEAEITVNGVHHLDYLTGGSSLICQKNSVSVLKEEYCGGEVETSDEFECELVGDILLHGENVCLQHVACSTGGLTVSGEAAVNLCVLKDDGLENYERLLPFKVELPCDVASVGMPCQATARVLSANLALHTDEERRKSKITIELTLQIAGMVCALEAITVTEDAFSTQCKLQLSKEERTFSYCRESLHFTERVSGVASLSAPIDYTTALQALVNQKVEANCLVGANGEELQGVLSATLLVSERDSTHRSVQVELPFALPLKGEVSGEKRISVLVLGMSVRQKREGEAEVEATLKFTVDVFEERKISFISAVEEGEAIQQSDSAFSVFLPLEGDGLWEIAKSLHKSPEDVLSSNPEMTFPVKKGERIIVYRQKV